MQHDELLDIRDEADRLGQQIESAVADLGPVTGTDPTRTVSATLDAKGVIDEVRVDMGWIDQMAPEDLKAAVFAAIADAGARRTAAWGEGFAQEQENPVPPSTRPLPMSDHAARLNEATGGRVDERAMVEVLTMMGSLDELIADFDARLEAATSAEHVARSSSGHVTARCHISGDVLDLDYDQRWLERAHAFNIGRETTDACRRAYLTATEKGLDAVVAESKLAKLQALLQDPEAFAQALRERTI